MNRRHENVSCQTNKKNKKAVKNGLEKETPAKKVEEKIKCAPCKESPHKKTSKRTSPSENIEGSPPSSPNKEGQKWGEMLKKQTEENNRRINLQENKRMRK